MSSLTGSSRQQRQAAEQGIQPRNPAKKSSMTRLFNDITETIGHTPLVRLNHLTQDAGTEVGAEVYAKLEFFNPLSSIKDRT